MNPAVIKTKKAHVYVGGKPIFEELKALYPDTLKPFRKTPRGDESYRVETIDHVLRLAQASGVLLN
jgi:hypothetical protein|tara:strand:+ start:220 stop:417 length:198 start_codon:yes stop_codon:yes gene_type:complete